MGTKGAPTGGDVARLLIPDETCWRTAHADRFSRITDGAQYLSDVKSAMLGAQRRIMLIGWDLDSRTAFETGDAQLPGPNHLGLFLHWLVWRSAPTSRSTCSSRICDCYRRSMDSGSASRL